jgi:hypothetical protein
VTALATIYRSPLTASLLAALRGCMIDGLDAETAKPPHNAADLSRYVILYPIEAGGFTGGPNLPEADATFCYQTTCVAKRVDQIEMLGDLVRRSMLTASVDSAHLTVMARWGAMPGGIQHEVSLFSLAERFYFACTST